ncbi:inorganic phosphate transporter [Atlantibacter hermannii]|nr:inorganic phosphate transporter [Atlantibacter hermannii]
MNRRYAHAHVNRLHQQNVQSIETSSLHLGLLGDMKRLNSLFCSVAYSVLEQPDDDDERDEIAFFASWTQQPRVMRGCCLNNLESNAKA